MVRNLKAGKPNQPAVLHKKSIFFLFLKKTLSLLSSTSDTFSISSAHRTCAKGMQVSRVIGSIFLYHSVTLGCIYARHRQAAGTVSNWKFTVCLKHSQPGSLCCALAVNKLQIMSVQGVVFGPLNISCIERDAASLCRGFFKFLFYFARQINLTQHLSNQLRCVIFILQAFLPAEEKK